MKIDGRKIAEKEYEQLSKKVEALKEKGVIPHLAVILVGNDPASVAYVNQKRKHGENIGAKVSILEYDETTATDELALKVKTLNEDKTVHGIIVQEPLPPHIDSRLLEVLTYPEKDVDGFHPDSLFIPPLSLAVIRILEEARGGSNEELISWLKKKTIAVLGKGGTGGKPVINYLEERGIDPFIVDSTTADPQAVLRKADIIITAVGKEGTIKPEMLKKGVILIGVGMSRGDDGKLHGDYREDEVKDIASFYTPVPGGVGPVNVAMLLKNLIRSAARKYTD